MQPEWSPLLSVRGPAYKSEKTNKTENTQNSIFWYANIILDWDCQWQSTVDYSLQLERQSKSVEAEMTDFLAFVYQQIIFCSLFLRFHYEN